MPSTQAVVGNLVDVQFGMHLCWPSASIPHTRPSQSASLLQRLVQSETETVLSFRMRHSVLRSHCSVAAHSCPNLILVSGGFTGTKVFGVDAGSL
jgi:hypothetical protein